MRERQNEGWPIPIFQETDMSPTAFLDTGRSLANRIPQSFVSLVARLAVANVFWTSGQTKVDGFFHVSDNTFYLFAEEYKVPLLPPELAAYLSTIAEHVFPVLLLVGLASRLSALALLGMTVVIQLFVYPTGWPEHILWATALLVIIARGPGALSLDHLIWRKSDTDRLLTRPSTTERWPPNLPRLSATHPGL
jgi:putative oxidoreductase